MITFTMVSNYDINDPNYDGSEYLWHLVVVTLMLRH